MIDIDLFTNILENKKNLGFIEYNEEIPDDLLDLFINTSAPMNKIQSLFKKAPTSTTNRKGEHSHKVKIHCFKCKKFIGYKELNLSKLMDYISDMKDKPPRKGRFGNGSFTCKKCFKEEEKETAASKRIREKKRKQEKKANTKFYINDILDPEMSWNKETTTREKLNIVFGYNLNHEAIQAHIQSMNYNDFLSTLYWSVISGHVKWRSQYKCQLCKGKSLLNTHHKNYDRHGLEHIYWKEDLICICQDCHEKFHDV